MRIRTFELMALTTCLLITAPGCDRAISAPAAGSEETTNTTNTGETGNTLSEAAMPEEALPPSGRPEAGPSALAPAGQPEAVDLNDALRGVVAMLKAGVEEDVLLKHIGNSPDPFNVDSAEIIYLTDLGASGTVIKAMMDRDQQLKSAQTTASTATQTREPWPPAGTVAEVPAAETSTAANATPPAATDEAGVAEAPAEPVSVSYFRSYLAPYGTWIDVPGYGLCWQPTVAVSCPGWMPYGDRGRWVYTNYGWYWYSDYSWGWAAFHYGRWFHHVRWGWCWVPGTVWGPSWVSWRYAAPYCGWAPLPPYSSSGFYFSIGISWGIPSWCYTYIPSYRICAVSPCRYAVPYSQARYIHHRSRIYNHYAVGANSTIENLGIPPAELTSDPARDIRRAQVRNRHEVPGRGGRRESLDKNNHTLTVFRPHRSERAGVRPQVASDGEPRSRMRGAGVPPRLNQMESHQADGTTLRNSSRNRPGVNSGARSRGPSGIVQTDRGSARSRVTPTAEPPTRRRDHTESSIERTGIPRSHITPRSANKQPVGTSTASGVNPRGSLVIRGRQESQRPDLRSTPFRAGTFDRSASDSRSIRIDTPESLPRQPGSPSSWRQNRTARPSVGAQTAPAARAEGRVRTYGVPVRPVEVPKPVPTAPSASRSRPAFTTPRTESRSIQRPVPPVSTYRPAPAPRISVPSPRQPIAPSQPPARSFSAPPSSPRSAPVTRSMPAVSAPRSSPPPSVRSAPPSTSRSTSPGRSGNRSGGRHR